MSGIIIDQNAIASSEMKASIVIKSIQEKIDLIKNENEDLFKRYMAFCSLESFCEFGAKLIELQRKAITEGYYINHELLQTDLAKESGFTELDIENHAFFTTKEKQEKDNKKRETFKALLKEMAKCVSDDENEKQTEE